ncbi:hypothetical protein ES703_74284 [subsurface metagenome]
MVKGAKINISGAFASHYINVLPQAAHYKGEGKSRWGVHLGKATGGQRTVCEKTGYAEVSGRRQEEEPSAIMV